MKDCGGPQATAVSLQTWTHVKKGGESTENPKRLQCLIGDTSNLAKKGLTLKGRLARRLVLQLQLKSSRMG